MSDENKVIFVGPDGGKELTNPIGGAMVAKLRDEDTLGAYSVHDNAIPPGSGLGKGHTCTGWPTCRGSRRPPGTRSRRPHHRRGGRGARRRADR